MSETQKRKEERLRLQFQGILKENAYEIVKIIENKENDSNFIKRLQNTGRSQFVNLAQIIHSNEITSIDELNLFLDYQHNRENPANKKAYQIKCFKDIKELSKDVINKVYKKCVMSDQEIEKICKDKSESCFCRKLQLMTVERLLVYLYWKTVKD